ncbi:TetR/AcrR family transcriptional regulator [Xylanimonas oleitrophica]|uniref:TetR/AcrR family transcriptional regulator n=1 Tax=Xylanimonas oleitrophica TaxID=2607479 RepID=UPI001FEB4527|nr:TetR/AcrR family transcriptional regulator [Xylanimonas oleitrophica]
MATTDSTRRRAAPLAPDDRRAAVIDAVMPLVAERGPDVTTKELAAAAGVAEGTLFRVFPDKHSLVGEAAIEGLRRASRPAETRAELAAVDRSAPLEQRLEQVIELGRARMGDVVRWMGVLRQLHARTAAAEVPHERMEELRAELFGQRELQRQATLKGLHAVLRPDEARLRVPLDVAVALLESAIAGTHARVDHLLPALPAAVVADALVHGLLSPSPNSDAGTSDAVPTAPAQDR